MDVKTILRIHPQQKTKVHEYLPLVFPISTISSYKSIENKHDVYRGNDCMKKFCKSLTDHTMEIIKFEINKRIEKMKLT